MAAANGKLATAKDVNRDHLPDLVFKQIPSRLNLAAGLAQIRMLGSTTAGTLAGGDAAATVR